MSPPTTTRRTADFNPENEKSNPSSSKSGRGKR
jgi:hypothetical protein